MRKPSIMMVKSLGLKSNRTEFKDWFSHGAVCLGASHSSVLSFLAGKMRVIISASQSLRGFFVLILKTIQDGICK